MPISPRDRPSPNHDERRLGAARHAHPALHRHDERPRPRSTGYATPPRGSARTMSSRRTARSGGWCRRSAAPGMPATAAGPGGGTSMPIPSASRSSIPVTNSAIARFPRRQIEAVEELSRGIIARWNIPARFVVGHSDIAPHRKQDPGELFPWQRLAGAGIGLWPDFSQCTAIRREPSPRSRKRWPLTVTTCPQPGRSTSARSRC